MPQLTQVPTNHTSAKSLGAVGITGLKTSGDRVFDIVQMACRNGADGLSGKEIQEGYELVYSKRIDSGTVSARVNGLIAAKRLERIGVARPCRVTGREIHPVRVTATQARLCY